MATAQGKHHDYHLVDPSPWPLVGSISAFIMALGAITWMHHLTSAAPVIFGVGLIGVLYTMASWWKDVIVEAQYKGDHTRVVQISHRYGTIRSMPPATRCSAVSGRPRASRPSIPGICRCSTR